MLQTNGAKNKQWMTQERITRTHGKPEAELRRHSTSVMSISTKEIRAKATVKDLEELYSALQGLVPKPKRSGNATTSGTDTDTAKEPDSDQFRPRLHRMYKSDRYLDRSKPDDNMNYTESALNAEKIEKKEVSRVLSDERLFASDTELELSTLRKNKNKPSLQRHFSLPIYEEESSNDMVDGDEETTPKRSRFLLFRRRRPRSKTHKKKSLSWRNFFSTLRPKSTKRSKKRSKNKVGQGVMKTEKGKQDDERRVALHKCTKKQLSSPLEERTRTLTPMLSYDVASSGTKSNRGTPQTQNKYIAPEPATVNSTENLGENEILLESKSDEVQKKLTAWYKHAVKETSSPIHKRHSKSCESLLTDTEIVRVRGKFSSDTDSVGGDDRNRVNMNMNKIRFRKTRARRNRKKERARWQSLPNVKLVSRALDTANKNTDQTKTEADDDDKAKEPEDIPTTTYVATVKSLEAKLSFGKSLEEKSQEEPMTDFMKVQNSSRWLSRQCSKTTISCIRPLQLNLFYSESPSRETIHRSRALYGLRRTKTDSNTIYEASDGKPQEFAFKIRQSSSQRRRKRRSFRRQTRLPHQSPFFVPKKTPTSSSKFSYASTKDSSVEDDSLPAKDSGLGSPDSVYEAKLFGPALMSKREQKVFLKLNCESDDSGWASRDTCLTDRADTAIQTDPVIVMTAVSKVRRPLLPHVINEDASQSDA